MGHPARAGTEKEAADQAVAPQPVAPQPAPDDGRHVPVLERLAPDGGVLGQTRLTLRDTLIGRDPEYATLVIDDATVARLHARLRQTDSNEFWLYDEGSETGTFLNHDRLGLAPRRVQHGDHIQFGRIAYRFALYLLEDLPPEPEAAVSPLPDVPDENSPSTDEPDGEQPTLPPNEEKKGEDPHDTNTPRPTTRGRPVAGVDHHSTQPERL
ncbi:MAG: FHA domain-containing protein [Chloroflexota bacterium]